MSLALKFSMVLGSQRLTPIRMPQALRQEEETDVVTDQAFATDWQAVGARLRASRESQGLQASVIAGKLCLSQRQVLAIESGETQPFPSDTTRVWCVRRYATLLGLDWVDVVGVPTPVTSSTPETAAEAMVDDRADATSRPRPRITPVVIAVTGALTVAAGFFAFNVQDTAPEAPIAAAPTPSGIAEAAREVPAARNDNVTPDAPAQATPAPAAEEIQGNDPTKSANAVFVRSDQPVIVYKRRRDGGEETRLEVSAGAATRVAIERGELLRIETPRDARLYFQGRQVPREAIERGAWLQFTPL